MKRLSYIFLFYIITCFLFCGRDETPVESKTGFIDVGNGAKLYYEEKGEGLPVIMIHGGFLTHRNWDDQFDVFIDNNILAVRYDARGHGRSVHVPGDYNHTEDLRIVLDSLKIDKAVLMGLSMGGYVSSDFALTYPDRVIGLILVSPGLTGYDFSKEEYMIKHYTEYGEDYQSGDPERIIEAFMRGWTDGPFRTPDQTPPDVRERSKQMCLETSKNLLEVQAREIRPVPPAIERLSKIMVPTLAILATLDMPSIAEIVELYEKNIPDFRKSIIEDAAHAVNMEKPEEFNRIVLNFIKNLK